MEVTKPRNTTQAPKKPEDKKASQSPRSQPGPQQKQQQQQKNSKDQENNKPAAKPTVAKVNPAPQPQKQHQEPPKAEKSQSSPNALCKVALVADYSFYQRHKKESGGIENYMRSLFAEMAGHITEQTKISYSVRSTHVISNPNDPNPLRGLSNQLETALDESARGVKRLPGYDSKGLCYTLVLSSKSFPGNERGLAFKGTACKDGDQNIGIVTDNRGELNRQLLTSMMMHESGHILGR